ncbi:cytochrome P450 [Candidatus Bathyarchaeota archaeon]|nr:cytochrome P450 [Candidatus Bathyarchaeota archaeon]
MEHRNPSIFGPDADEFRPERWLADDADNLSRMNRHWMPASSPHLYLACPFPRVLTSRTCLQFGLGSRTCIGRHISLLEISKLIPLLVRDFNFELSGDLAKGESWSTTGYWFVKPTDFIARVSRRDGKA